MNLEKLLNMTLFTLCHLQILTMCTLYHLQILTNRSAPNLVKMYVIIRFQMNLIMDLIGPELFKLSAFTLENLPYLTLFTL